MCVRILTEMLVCEDLILCTDLACCYVVDSATLLYSKSILLVSSGSCIAICGAELRTIG